MTTLMLAVFHCHSESYEFSPYKPMFHSFKRYLVADFIGKQDIYSIGPGGNANVGDSEGECRGNKKRA